MPDAAQKIREFHPRYGKAGDDEIFNASLRLSDAQLTIARERGFPSWARLKRHIEQPTLADRLDLPHHERIEDPTFRRAVELIDAGKAGELRALLQQRPGLVHQHVVFEGGKLFPVANAAGVRGGEPGAARKGGGEHRGCGAGDS